VARLGRGHSFCGVLLDVHVRGGRVVVACVSAVASVAANRRFFEVLRARHRLRDAPHVHRPLLALRNTAALLRDFHLLLV
jgi:hypothetical protein